MGRPFIFDDENENNTGISSTMQPASRNKAVRQNARPLAPNTLMLTISSEELPARENLQHGAETVNVQMQQRQEHQQPEMTSTNINVTHEFSTIPLSPALTRAFRSSEARMQKRLETLQLNLAGGGERQGIDSIGQLQQCRIPILPQVNPQQHNQDTASSLSSIGTERSPFIVSGI